MSKFADLVMSLAILLLLTAVVFRLSPLSVYVVQQKLGLALIGCTSIALATGLCVKAGYGFGSDLKQNLVYLSTFCFSFLFLDLVLFMQNMLNEQEPVYFVITSLIVTAPALVVLHRDLKGKRWFST